MSWEGAAERWVLSAILAALLWIAVAAERLDELTLTVPVVLEQVPASVTAVQAPRSVRVTLSGPRILLFRTGFSELVCRLDLHGTPPGTVSFPSLESALDLDRELKVARVYPAPLTVTLAREGGR